MPRDPIPALPSSMDAPGGRVRIVVKKTGTVKAGKTAAYGTWEKHTRTVEIESGASLRHQWWTLYHELVHVAMEDSGVWNLLPDRHQEAICDAIATGRVRERCG